MEPINQSIEVVSAVLGPIHQIIGVLQWIIGGVFGVYLAILVYNWYKNRKLLKEIAELRDDVRFIKHELAILTKKNKKTK